MSSNILIFIDLLASLLTYPLALIFRIRTRIFNYFRIKTNSNKILIIKFLGAGNFISLSNVIKTSEFHIISIKQNKSSLQKFIPNAKLILLDETNIKNLFFTSSLIILKLLFSSYKIVINIEAESSFAKFLASIPFSNSVSGLSNKYKSTWDYLFYDTYLVSPSNLNKDRILKILLGEDKSQVNKLNKLTIDSFNNLNLEHKLVIKKNNLIISPACSSTDRNRRLSIKIWGYILNNYAPHFKAVTINFPSKQDSQYIDFLCLLKLLNFNNVNLYVETFSEFTERIQNCDLLITIDSQALHIAQKFNKPTICFYGPTSPHGVKLLPSTIAISKELECSPCTHKYFKLPCKNSIDCMKFNKKEIGIVPILFKKSKKL